VSSPIWGSWPDIYYCLTVTVLFLWAPLNSHNLGTDRIENTASNSSYIFVCASIATETCFPIRCVATAVSSGCTILAFSPHVTILQLLHLRLSLPGSIFPSRSSTRTMHSSFFCSRRTMYLSYKILLDLTILIMFGEECKFWSPKRPSSTITLNRHNFTFLCFNLR
jgi:hypothetical protein